VRKLATDFAELCTWVAVVSKQSNIREPATHAVARLSPPKRYRQRVITIMYIHYFTWVSTMILKKIKLLRLICRLNQVFLSDGYLYSWRCVCHQLSVHAPVQQRPQQQRLDTVNTWMNMIAPVMRQTTVPVHMWLEVRWQVLIARGNLDLTETSNNLTRHEYTHRHSQGVHCVHVHPQGGEKNCAIFTGESCKCTPRQRVHPRGRAKVKCLRTLGRFGRWERLFRQF